MPLTLLVALEQEVSEESKPLFIRAYAWYRLLRHSCILRYSDTKGCSPQSLRTRARGVYGVLELTKTTGSDNGVSVLPIVASIEAYVRQAELQARLLPVPARC